MRQVADIGHLYAPQSVHIKWSERLEEEMWLQGDVEKQRNMKVIEHVVCGKHKVPAPLALLATHAHAAHP